MALNFWKSTHYKNWTSQLTKNDIQNTNPGDQNHFTLDELKKIQTYIFSTIIQELGKKLGLRQIVIASSIVFYRRFYLSNSYSTFDPRLVAATVVYISAKTEECQVRIDTVVRTLWQLTTEKNDPIAKIKHTDVLECEFYVVECLKFDLVVYHPYRPLLSFLSDVGLEKECLTYAWGICNDAYITDAIMLYPPYMVALACVYLSLVYVQRDPTEWLQRLNVNQTELEAVVETLLNLYRTYQPTSKIELEKLLTKLNQIVPPLS